MVWQCMVQWFMLLLFVACGALVMLMLVLSLLVLVLLMLLWVRW